MGLTDEQYRIDWTGPSREGETMGKLLYAAVSYALFLASFLWTIAFLGNFVVPKTIDIDAGSPASLAQAFIVDGALLLLFAVQHSVMARPWFKRGWTRIVPPAIERATYVLASTLVLLALLAFWEPMPGVVWRVESSVARAAIWGIFGVGWVIVLLSTFLIDHFHLFGLRQVLHAMKGEAEREPTFKKVLFYRLVRHPLMVGFLVAFWATPTMSLGHLVFALATTGYILVGVHLEERDLRASLGEVYDDYRKEVRMLLPIPRRAK
jgi:methanethiol S-methyltransferase